MIKCKCGLECIFFPKLGAWLCIKCDWKDIEAHAKECEEKVK
jgi:hypothetical protein